VIVVTTGTALTSKHTLVGRSGELETAGPVTSVTAARVAAISEVDVLSIVLSAVIAERSAGAVGEAERRTSGFSIFGTAEPCCRESLAAAAAT
jgi:hypothetical protein